VPRKPGLILWFPWQNCSPQSSESTEPPGSPQECDMEATQASEPPGPAIYTQAPAYVYPGYMFGPPMYNVNGKYNSLSPLLMRSDTSGLKGRICTIFAELSVLKFCGHSVSNCYCCIHLLLELRDFAVTPFCIEHCTRKFTSCLQIGEPLRSSSLWLLHLKLGSIARCET
jgi:hypothetical protein